MSPNCEVEGNHDYYSSSNQDDCTRGEMRVKRQDYFTAGVELYWEIDPTARIVAAYTSITDVATLTIADTLDGGSVLPGFTLLLQDLFAELDRHG